MSPEPHLGPTMLDLGNGTAATFAPKDTFNSVSKDSNHNLKALSKLGSTTSLLNKKNSLPTAFRPPSPIHADTDDDDGELSRIIDPEV